MAFPQLPSVAGLQVGLDWTAPRWFALGGFEAGSRSCSRTDPSFSLTRNTSQLTRWTGSLQSAISATHQATHPSSLMHDISHTPSGTVGLSSPGDNEVIHAPPERALIQAALPQPCFPRDQCPLQQLPGVRVSSHPYRQDDELKLPPIQHNVVGHPFEMREHTGDEGPQSTSRDVSQNPSASSNGVFPSTLELLASDNRKWTEDCSLKEQTPSLTMSNLSACIVPSDVLSASEPCGVSQQTAEPISMSPPLSPPKLGETHSFLAEVPGHNYTWAVRINHVAWPIVYVWIWISPYQGS